MASIADLLGVTGYQSQPRFRLHPHAAAQADDKGFTKSAVLDAANNPAHAYDNGRFPGQRRHVKGDIVAIVDPAKGLIITVYANVRETPLRADQVDRDARRYGKRLVSA